MPDETKLGDWVPEIIAVLVFGGVYAGLIYNFFLAELGTTGTIMLWLGFVLSLIVLFGADKVKKALDIAKQQS